MLHKPVTDRTLVKAVDYDQLAASFNDALVSTLRRHSVAEGFLDFWVPDADPVRGIAGMVDSARIAGVGCIEIHVRRTTLPAERLHELEQLLSKSCTLALESRGEVVVLRVTDLKQIFAAKGPASDDWKPQYGQTGAARDARSSAPKALTPWDDAALPEFSDTHPHFRSGLAAALANLSREGDIGRPEADLVYVSGSEGASTLMLAIDPQTHAVRKAWHKGASRPSERATLDLFCKAAEKVPIQEVADHTGLKVLHSLVDQDKTTPVPGVLLPINAGAPFVLPSRLARQAYDAYRARIGTGQETNFYYRPPPKEWQDLSTQERLERVGYVLRGFLQSEGLYPDDMCILRIQRNKFDYEVRVNIGFSDRVAVADKPNLMRQLEKRLRRDLKTEIDLVADRARDTSPLRRLS